MKVEIIGNLGHPAETKTTKDGQRQFLQFSVAENKQVNGQKVTQWVNVIYNGTKVAPYLVKGAKVFVRGDLNANLYTKKDGTSAIDLTIYATELQIVEFADKAENQQQSAADREAELRSGTTSGTNSGYVTTQTTTTTAEPVDDLPFL